MIYLISITIYSYLSICWVWFSLCFNVHSSCTLNTVHYVNKRYYYSFVSIVSPLFRKRNPGTRASEKQLSRPPRARCSWQACSYPTRSWKLAPVKQTKMVKFTNTTFKIHDVDSVSKHSEIAETHTGCIDSLVILILFSYRCWHATGVRVDNKHGKQRNLVVCFSSNHHAYRCHFH